MELGESLLETECSELGFRKVKGVVPGTQLFPPLSVCYHLPASDAHLSRAWWAGTRSDLSSCGALNLVLQNLAMPSAWLSCE